MNNPAQSNRRESDLELSPCKCGAKMNVDGNLFYGIKYMMIICRACDRKSPPRKTERGAINAWNRMNIPNQSWGKR